MSTTCSDPPYSMNECALNAQVPTCCFWVSTSATYLVKVMQNYLYLYLLIRHHEQRASERIKKFFIKKAASSACWRRLFSLKQQKNKKILINLKTRHHHRQNNIEMTCNKLKMEIPSLLLPTLNSALACLID